MTFPIWWKVIIQPCSSHQQPDRVSTKVMQDFATIDLVGLNPQENIFQQSWTQTQNSLDNVPESPSRPRFGAVWSPSLWFPIGPSQWKKTQVISPSYVWRFPKNQKLPPVLNLNQSISHHPQNSQPSPFPHRSRFSTKAQQPSPLPSACS